MGSLPSGLADGRASTEAGGQESEAWGLISLLLPCWAMGLLHASVSGPPPGPFSLLQLQHLAYGGSHQVPSPGSGRGPCYASLTGFTVPVSVP